MNCHKLITPLIIGVVSIVTGLTAQGVIRKSPELAFRLPGQGEKLLSQYRGKVVALEFILTSCPHCQAATKVMNKMQEQYGSRGLQVIDVAVDPNADLRVGNFAKDYQTKFPVGWVPIEQMMAYMGFTNRPLVPQLVLIDRDGNIHYQTGNTGDAESLQEQVIDKRIQELLQLKAESSRNNRGGPAEKQARYTPI